VEHSGPVNAVLVTPDGSQIVSASDDSTIRIWDRATEQLVHELLGHTTRVLALAITPDGTQIISSSSGGTVRIWDRVTGKEVGEPRGGYEGEVNAVLVSPDGAEIIAGYDRKVIVWNRLTGQEIDELQLDDVSPISAMAITPDATRIFVAGASEQVIIWDRAARSVNRWAHGHGQAVQAVAISPDGTKIATAGSNRAIHTWDPDSGKRTAELSGQPAHLVKALMFTPNDELVSDVGSIVGIWHLTTDRQTDIPLTGGHSGGIRAVAVTPDGRQIVSGGADGTVRTWDISLFARHSFFARHSGEVTALVVTWDGSQIISGGDDGEIITWDLASRRQIGEAWRGHTGSVRSLAITPHDRRVVSGGDDGTTRIWDRTTGQQVAVLLPRNPAPVLSVAVTPDDSVIVSGCGHSVYMWDRATGQQIGDPLTGHTDLVQAIAITPDIAHIISAGDDGSVLTWDSKGVMLIHMNAESPVRAIAVPADADQIVCGEIDGTVRIWERKTGRQVGEPLLGHTEEVHTLTVVGRRIVSASHDGTVRIWDRETGQQIGGPLLGGVTAMAVTPNGNQVVSADYNGIIQVRALFARVRGMPLAEVASDVESGEDRLNIADDVNTIAAVVAALSTQPPLSVALLGDWGMGKSTFMRQVQDRVEAVSRSGSTAFAGNVRQVRFNAWHYSDDHLWVGLVEHLFRELAKPGMEAAPEEITDLEVTLSTRQAERERLDTDLRAVDRIDTGRGWLGKLSVPFRSARVARVALRGGWRELRSQTWLIVVAGLVILGGAAAIVFGAEVLKWAGGVAAVVAAAITPVVAAWRRLDEYTEQARRELLERKSEVDGDIRKVEAKLSKLDPARRLDKLLAEISTPERYESYRGLTGRIHHDLRRLSDDLKTTREHWERSGSVGVPPLQRIVLYVDDLDRCEARRVVDVLQAVNLLLTMELFVVVVAVDPRWLLRSLKRHHQGLFDDNEVAYLDKIFHIPFALRPMGDHAVGYLRSLLPLEEVTEESSPSVVPVPRPESATRRETVSQQQVQQRSVARTEIPRQQPVAHSPAGLRLRTSEREFLARLTPLLATPRAVKKLVNLYRLLRLGVPESELDAFVGGKDGGPYQAAALLLAALVGAPNEAPKLLAALAKAAPEQEVLSTGSLGQLITQLRKDIPVHGNTETYRKWAATVARYGFETYDLFVG
jgi:WD40 repeat protein